MYFLYRLKYCWLLIDNILQIIKYTILLFYEKHKFVLTIVIVEPSHGAVDSCDVTGSPAL